MKQPTRHLSYSLVARSNILHAYTRADVRLREATASPSSGVIRPPGVLSRLTAVPKRHLAGELPRPLVFPFGGVSLNRSVHLANTL